MLERLAGCLDDHKKGMYESLTRALYMRHISKSVFSRILALDCLKGMPTARSTGFGKYLMTEATLSELLSSEATKRTSAAVDVDAPGSFLVRSSEMSVILRCTDAESADVFAHLHSRSFIYKQASRIHLRQHPYPNHPLGRHGTLSASQRYLPSLQYAVAFLQENLYLMYPQPLMLSRQLTLGF